jgi:hypothetical protein
VQGKIATGRFHGIGRLVGKDVSFKTFSLARGRRRDGRTDSRIRLEEVSARADFQLAPEP